MVSSHSYYEENLELAFLQWILLMTPLQILGSAGSLRNFFHFDGDFLRFHG